MLKTKIELIVKKNKTKTCLWVTLLIRMLSLKLTQVVFQYGQRLKVQFTLNLMSFMGINHNNNNNKHMHIQSINVIRFTQKLGLLIM